MDVVLPQSYLAPATADKALFSVTLLSREFVTIFVVELLSD